MKAFSRYLFAHEFEESIPETHLTLYEQAAIVLFCRGTEEVAYLGLILFTQTSPPETPISRTAKITF